MKIKYKKLIKIGIVGFGGKMGQAIAKLAMQDPTISIKGASEYSKHKFIGKDIGDLLGESSVNTYVSDNIQSFFNRVFKIFGLISLIITILLIAGIEIFNFINLQALHEICYSSHDLSSEKLKCCLDANYVWKEGFAFSKNTPIECEKYMNWND